MTDSFGRYLRSRREELGLTRQRVADESGLSYAYIAQLEKGTKSRPSLTALHQLAHGLGIPPDELAAEAGVPLDASSRPSSRPPSSRTAQPARDVSWLANPRFDAQEATPAPVRASRPAGSPELTAARSDVLPALQRLLSTYTPVTRLALLADLQADALAELQDRD